MNDVDVQRAVEDAGSAIAPGFRRESALDDLTPS